MKLKYYLRGLGIGIIITSIILMIASSGSKTEMTDAEIIKRAEELGMVMKEDPLFPSADNSTENSEVIENTEVPNVTEELEMTEETESTEEIETTEVAEGTEETETTEVQGSTEETSEETESTEETETIEVTPSTEETETIEDTQASENTEATVEGEKETYHLVIPAGGIPRLICNELEENGVVESSAELRQYLSDVGFIKSISVGEYDIPYGSTNEEVYQILKAGPIKR